MFYSLFLVSLVFSYSIFVWGRFGKFISVLFGGLGAVVGVLLSFPLRFLIAMIFPPLTKPDSGVSIEGVIAMVGGHMFAIAAVVLIARRNHP